MSDDGEVSYNNSNRAFLQAFIARSTMTYEESKPILSAIFTAYVLTGEELENREILPNDISEADFHSYVSAANHAISPFDLEIRSTYHQVSRTRVYALVNSTDDPITQLATSHSPDEIGFLKRVLDAMFETYNTSRQEIMAITSMQAVRLYKPSNEDRRETQNGSATQGSAGQGISMMQAEKMLKSLVEEGWFEKSRKGFYSLSPRALMELRNWLLDTYNELDDDEGEDQGRVLRVKLCYACKEIVTTKFFQTQKSRKCPVCKTDWTGENFVGERAVTAKDKSTQHRRRSDGGRESREMAMERASEDEDEDEDEDS
ncbi:hypothetical protein MMC20_004915 [Loxospora ochrophaea]|nr:hypothetical protein [Loxospora ochrophaea]